MEKIDFEKAVAALQGKRSNQPVLPKSTQI